MHKKTIDNIISILTGISALTVIIGAVLKIQHYSNAYMIFLNGIILYILLSSIERMRLENEIKRLKKMIENEQNSNYQNNTSD